MADLQDTKTIYKQTDFYYNTPIEDKTYLSFLEDRRVPLDDSDVYIVVQPRHQFKPYILSYDLYSSEDYWWVIARHNMDLLIDPIRDLREGMVLRVPTVDRVKRFIG